jgi:hypothetical protein
MCYGIAATIMQIIACNVAVRYVADVDETS